VVWSSQDLVDSQLEPQRTTGGTRKAAPCPQASLEVPIFAVTWRGRLAAAPWRMTVANGACAVPDLKWTLMPR